LNHQQRTIDLLLSIKGVSSLTDGRKCLPIYAARYGSAETVQSCCTAATAHINSKETQARTPLLWAAYAGNQEALETLIKNGADPKLTDYKGFSILCVAKEENNESMAHWILENTGNFLDEQNYSYNQML
jgi:ankyrin repeat protein